MSWTPAKTKELSRRWNDGETSGQIARAMRLSRCAVIGKLNRIGLIGDMTEKERRRRVHAGYTADIREQMSKRLAEYWRTMPLEEYARWYHSRWGRRAA